MCTRTPAEPRRAPHIDFVALKIFEHCQIDARFKALRRVDDIRKRSIAASDARSFQGFSFSLAGCLLWRFPDCARDATNARRHFERLSLGQRLEKRKTALASSSQLARMHGDDRAKAGPRAQIWQRRFSTLAAAIVERRREPACLWRKTSGRRIA